LYENRTMKLAELGLDGWGGMSENGNWVSLTKVHCKHVWKYHNETICTTNIYKQNVLKKGLGAC
jgi:hypothetical protein